METTLLSLPLVPVATALVVGLLVALLLLWRRGGQAKAAPSASHARSNGALAAKEEEEEVDGREKCVILFGEPQGWCGMTGGWRRAVGGSRGRRARGWERSRGACDSQGGLATGMPRELSSPAGALRAAAEFQCIHPTLALPPPPMCACRHPDGHRGALCLEPAGAAGEQVRRRYRL